MDLFCHHPSLFASYYHHRPQGEVTMHTPPRTASESSIVLSLWPPHYTAPEAPAVTRSSPTCIKLSCPCLELVHYVTFSL